MHAPNSEPATQLDLDTDEDGTPCISKLTPQQVNAATLLAAGQSYSQVALALSVGRTTLYRWRQTAEFSAYLNILMRQTADEALLRSSCLMTSSFRVVQQRLDDPATSPAEQLRVALRLLALYTSPRYLKFLDNRPDDPNEMVEAQMQKEYREGDDDEPHFTPADRELFLGFKGLLLDRAMAFDAKYPNAGLPPQIPQPIRTTAGTAKAKAAKTAKPPKMEQSGTSARTSAAIAAAVSGVLPQSLQPRVSNHPSRDGRSSL